MDGSEPEELRAEGSAASERHDRCGVGAGEAVGGCTAARPGAAARQVDLREVPNAVFYTLETGCQWRALPRDLPPRSTVHGYFIRWQCDRTLSKLHHELYVHAREQTGKEASPTTAIVDSQSIRSAERGAERRIRLAGMPARRSRDASAMRSSIRSG